MEEKEFVIANVATDLDGRKVVSQVKENGRDKSLGKYGSKDNPMPSLTEFVEFMKEEGYDLPSRVDITKLDPKKTKSIMFQRRPGEPTSTALRFAAHKSGQLNRTPPADDEPGDDAGDEQQTPEPAKPAKPTPAEKEAAARAEKVAREKRLRFLRG